MSWGRKRNHQGFSTDDPTETKMEIHSLLKICSSLAFFVSEHGTMFLNHPEKMKVAPQGPNCRSPKIFSIKSKKIHISYLCVYIYIRAFLFALALNLLGPPCNGLEFDSIIFARHCL